MISRIRRPTLNLLKRKSTAVCAFSTRCSDNSFAGFASKGSIQLSALAVTAALLCASSPLLSNNSDNICAAESHPSPNPGNINNEESFEDDVPDLDSLPIYSSAEVAANNGKDGSPIWMSYGGVVYDVTNFVHNHPGGSERILLAAGGAVEPFWHLYRQHFASDLPMRYMEKMIVGKLREEDQDAIDDQMTKMMDENEDPYAHEPKRSDLLIVHGDQPMNAEVPAEILLDQYLTPNELFYIRHHHPVPFLIQKDIDNFELEIDLGKFSKDSGSEGSKPFKISLQDLKALPKVDVVTTLQCSGNRRGDMNSVRKTSGTSWSQGAISTAKFSGVRLIDVLKAAGVEDPIALTEKDGVQKHLRMESLDGMKASIVMEKATNPYGDVIIAYEMNDEPIPRDHGFPLRVIVPGYAAVRNVKWLKKIEVSDSEAEGAWQQGLNYKTLPPNVTDAKEINLAKMPSMTEVAVFSGVSALNVVGNPRQTLKAGKKVTVKAKGWAWAGGGRNIVRVDITGDGGKSWQSAEITKGGDQKFGKAWAWVFWECDVPAIVKNDGTIEVASKAVDLAFNSQPESCAHGWNVRGLGNNSWHRASTRS
jgi:sulfite oxidase